MAALCYQWPTYVDEAFRDSMLRRKRMKHSRRKGVPVDGRYPFKCPTCLTGFLKLSGLFQHVEGDFCEQSLDSGAIAELTQFLSRQLGGRYPPAAVSILAMG